MWPNTLWQPLADTQKLEHGVLKRLRLTSHRLCQPTSLGTEGTVDVSSPPRPVLFAVVFRLLLFP